MDQTKNKGTPAGSDGLSIRFRQLICSRGFRAVAAAGVVGILAGSQQYSDAFMAFAAFHFYFLQGKG